MSGQNTAVANLVFDTRIPTFCEEVMASQIDDGIATFQAEFPGTGDCWIALNDFDASHGTGTADFISTARKYHRLITAGHQAFDNLTTNQAATAGQ